MAESDSAVLTLTLLPDKHVKERLYRVPIGTTIQFELDSMFRGRNMRFQTNYPQEGAKFNRTKFHQMSFESSAHTPNADRYCRIHFEKAGNFDIKYNVCGWNEEHAQDGIIYNACIVVEPEVRLGTKTINLDNLSLMTMIPNCMGPVSEWKNQLKVASETGFQAVHLCPIQEQGRSKSCYSLKDQLKLNSDLFDNDPGTADKQLADVVSHANTPKEEGGLSLLLLVDLVYNHTSPDAPWLKDHPEACYNLNNSPHLRPGFVLDQALKLVSKQIGDGSIPLPALVESEADIDAIIAHVWDQVYPQLQLTRLSQVDLEDNLNTFKQRLAKPSDEGSHDGKLFEAHPKKYETVVNMDLALAQSGFYEHGDQSRAIDWIRAKIDDRNNHAEASARADFATAMQNLRNMMKYERLDPSGPCKKGIDQEHPLVDPYFTVMDEAVKRPMTSFEQDALDCFDGTYIYANNGWIWGGNPASDFIAPEHDYYFRRDIIIWGDCVKLRYGSQPSDSPWLWKHMADYTRKMCKSFHGVRIDNCHSTPLHVGQYMMDAGRSVRSNLIVVAELFTNSQEQDAIYTNVLGISCLVGEGMTPSTTKDYSTHLHRLAGPPIGSFTALAHKPLQVPERLPRHVFVDASHDTEYPGQKYTLEQTLPLLTLNSMLCNGCGSTRGVDELWSAKAEVVNDPRRYRSWSDTVEDNQTSVGPNTGIMRFRRQMNTLHSELGEQGYSEAYVDHMLENVVSLTRRNPKTLMETTAVAHTAYSGDFLKDDSTTLTLSTPGCVTSVVLFARPVEYSVSEGDFASNPTLIGHSIEYESYEDVEPSAIPHLSIDNTEKGDRVTVTNFRPGSVFVFKVSPMEKASTSVQRLEKLLASPVPMDLDIVDLNHVLYRCNPEEETSEHKGDGCYRVPGYGQLKFVGLSGLIPLLDEIVAANDLGHALCDNVRQGSWLLAFLAQHMNKRFACKPLGTVLKKAVALYDDLPVATRPRAFSQVISHLYKEVLREAFSSVLEDQAGQDLFSRQLALTAAQLYGNDGAHTVRQGHESLPSMAAGLPHFASGWMRSWGRDTFIALRGLLLVTGQYEAAKDIILAYGRVVRHGLIPNLFDGGRNPRYNCRDATWWWLQAIKDYCQMAPLGEDILFATVERRFPNDNQKDAEEHASGNMKLHKVIQEILTKHVNGIEFREWNAGSRIDGDMCDEGFNVKVWVDLDTGLIYGGSRFNCGTWMDKMGSSTKAGNKGVPATPRDGAAVEIQGLAASVLSWLCELSNNPVGDIALSNGKTRFTLQQWRDLLHQNFERYFYVPLESEDDGNFAYDPSLVHRRGIYKDTAGSSDQYTDYQLRPNFAIALAVAPELCDPKHGRHAVKVARNVLLGPLGARTLDPKDWKYRPNYHNDDDSDDFAVAKGFNYHQGPEWLWPIGYLFRAMLHFTEDKLEAAHSINSYFGRHEAHLKSSHWQGLPELCNENGSYCPDSCPTQAWSTSCILDVLYDMQASLHPRASSPQRRSKKMALIQLGRRTSSIVDED
eukprot:m.247081 g.247081  ORF g.247081 m.247081 type:complete len:1516 (+) comp17479_c0_seq20:110-4657(+)